LDMGPRWCSEEIEIFFDCKFPNPSILRKFSYHFIQISLQVSKRMARHGTR